MCENVNYKLDLEAIKNTFKFKDKGLIHNTCSKFKLLPYVTNENNLVEDFSGVVGAFSRIISDKKLSRNFETEIFLEEVIDQIGEFEGNNSKEVFKDIVKSIFIDKDNLVNFDIKTINYISSTANDGKIANFLYSVLFDENEKENIKKYYERDVDNIFYKLILKSLPKLNDDYETENEYKCYLPFIKELFIKDFKFIISNEDLYKNSLKRFLEYYYMFYVSQLIMKLNQFEKADLTKPDILYYTLDWESTSKTRTAYQFGWEKIKNSTNLLFSHAVVLEMLNHTEIEEQLGYNELAELFINVYEDNIEKQLELLIQTYKNQIEAVVWENFNYTEKQTDVKAFNLVYKLFNVVRYQFENSSRCGPRDRYKNWFTKFAEKNFLKKRGPLGYNLNLTEDDIILMTKICVNNNEKIKLNTLFEEFELRGLFFDRDSKMKIIQLYEKLNLLEKKSDSGDAQYVKSIL